jgi:hypothetical protein
LFSAREVILQDHPDMSEENHPGTRDQRHKQYRFHDVNPLRLQVRRSVRIAYSTFVTPCLIPVPAYSNALVQRPSCPDRFPQGRSVAQQWATPLARFFVRL